ncbi:MAG: hypothetical protein ACK4TL_02305 [Hyphomicrobiaceae bacterium]
MFESELDDPQWPARQPAPTLTLDAQDVATLSTLMRELRDITQSRGSFRAASAFLRRLGAETEGPRLVPADALDR